MGIVSDTVYDDTQVMTGHVYESDETEELREMGVDPDATQDNDDPLRKADAQRRFRKVRAWWAWERARQSEERSKRIKDHDVYDGDQWAADDRAVLEERAQKATVINVIKPTMQWIIGTERRTRAEWRVLPRKRQESKIAEVKTKYVKYIEDVNKASFERSFGFKDASISGLGWLEVCIIGDDEDEPIYVGYVDWRSMWYDSYGTKMDMSDWRYAFRSKWVDVDVACAMFPEYAANIRAQAATSYTYYEDEEGIDDDSLIVQDGIEDLSEGFYKTNRRSRIELVEAWYREPTKKSRRVLRGKDLGSLNGVEYDEADATHQALLDNGYASIVDNIVMEMRCQIFTGNLLLQDEPSPYRHNRFPFVPIWAYRKKRDGSPYGEVRNLIDMQDDINKRWSKALHILSSGRVVVDDDATDNWQEFEDEVRRADGIIRKKAHSQLAFPDDRSLSEEHVQLLQLAINFVQRVSGITDENLGRQTNATSGVAINSRQDQGFTVTAELFDNLRFSVKMCGELVLSLIEQYSTDEKTIRITGERPGDEDYEDINTVDPRTGEVLNDITASQADFVVDTATYSATMRQAMFESMVDLIGKLAPEMAIKLLDMIIDISDIPGKDYFVKRVREVNGMEDPFADMNDPQVRAAQQAKAQEAQRQQRLAQLMQELEVAMQGAEVDKKNAETQAILDKIKTESLKGSIEKVKVLHQIEQAERDVDNGGGSSNARKVDRRANG